MAGAINSRMHAGRGFAGETIDVIERGRELSTPFSANGPHVIAGVQVRASERPAANCSKPNRCLDDSFARGSRQLDNLNMPAFAAVLPATVSPILRVHLESGYPVSALLTFLAWDARPGRHGTASS
jgi:hypothetical protein